MYIYSGIYIYIYIYPMASGLCRRPLSTCVIFMFVYVLYL